MIANPIRGGAPTKTNIEKKNDLFKMKTGLEQHRATPSTPTSKQITKNVQKNVKEIKTGHKREGRPTNEFVTFDQCSWKNSYSVRLNG